ncbi:hypothetical protein ONS95_014446 [Cadophora gregata]|uniref:uncharacterized protein n=1 Tax=Cadophora gregata TaxID=51156 RepID=UPI0026DA7AF9|nr:uncharacterized protein ONS95_014446 [Cadophora gregata]KAK0112710.1 hypothetical protein ONS95_014446 [Cadophora gregata]KAK0124843.1 hypothetical protein ONS96_008722 [Cadophora gregata f. sp. sojae]
MPTSSPNPNPQPYSLFNNSPRWLCCKTPPNAVVESPCLQGNALSEKGCKKCQHQKCDLCLTFDGREDGGES